MVRKRAGILSQSQRDPAALSSQGCHGRYVFNRFATFWVAILFRLAGSEQSRVCKQSHEFHEFSRRMISLDASHTMRLS
jgi:hypothetical protein